ncbi:MAG: chemotaxis protein CheW [Gemmatimonadetes bacterium]|nr:chemotaxis protein CheW [Gemmatimonadota bacterium]
MIYPADPERVRRGDAPRSGYVSFRLADQWLGLPVVLAQEVLAPQRISPIPLAPADVAGFLNLRGQIVTAVDLRIRLGLPLRGEGEGAMNIVVRDGEELFSFLVDEVGDVVEVGTDQIGEVPATLDEQWKACCQGVIRLERGLLLIMDPARLLNPVEAAA